MRQPDVLDGTKRWHRAGRDAGSIPHRQTLVEGGIAPGKCGVPSAEKQAERGAELSPRHEQTRLFPP